MILGGLVDLYQITNDESLLQQAIQIADATISTLVNGDGILSEPPPTPADEDGRQFKGIFVRNLLYLYETTGTSAYADFIRLNADAIWSMSRNSENQFGFLWEGPFDSGSPARQSSALDAINAAIACSYDGTTYQAEDGTLHGLSTENTNRGYHGNGYVAGWVQDGQWVDFDVNVDDDGQYDLVWRYSASNGRAVRLLYVNGATVYDQLSFPNTGCWTSWNTVVSTNVPLHGGSNRVSLIFNADKGSSNFLNLDELTVDGA